MISGHLIQAIAPAYARRDDSAGELFTPREFTSGREVGIVELVGPLGKRELVHARERVNKLAADDLVGEILVVVDSPGGTVAGTHDLYAAIDRATKIKRVTAVVEDLAASAAYWAIAGASEIVLNPTGEVGSIGVFVVLADASRMFEKLGVDVLVIRSGRHKGTGTLGTKVTAEDIEQLQAVVDEHGRHFLAAVAHGRRMTAERVNDFADGRILVGNQAKAAGLVDRIATIETVLAETTARNGHLMFAELTGFAAQRKLDELLAHTVNGEADERARSSAESTIFAQYPRLAKAVKAYRSAEHKRAERDRISRQLGTRYA